jgi:hypothetical protein
MSLVHHPPREPRPARRDALVVAAIVVAAILTATPGVHLFERWLAVLVSHGIAVVLLAVAARRWRRARASGDAA